MTDLSWERINSSMSVGHSNVLAFVDLVLCFPSSSVCEQGFSRMKYTKTDWRNQLNSSSLSDQLTVMLHMPAVGEFNPTNSVLLWHKSGPEVEDCVHIKENVQKVTGLVMSLIPVIQIVMSYSENMITDILFIYLKDQNIGSREPCWL